MSVIEHTNRKKGQGPNVLNDGAVSSGTSSLANNKINGCLTSPTSVDDAACSPPVFDNISTETPIRKDRNTTHELEVRIGIFSIK